MSAALAGLRSYVVEKDASRYDDVDATLVLLEISHSNLQQRWPDIRFSRHITIGEMKNKLYIHGGTSPRFQNLVLKTKSGSIELSDDSKKLGYYSPDNGDRLHIVDLDPFSPSLKGGLENVNLVQKYEISEEDYMKRDENARKYKIKMQAQDPSWNFSNAVRKNKENQNPTSNHSHSSNPDEPCSSCSSSISSEEASAVEKNLPVVKSRCKVLPGNRRGEIRYVGECDGLLSKHHTGTWVGVALDEPVGKNDGSINGHAFFLCMPKHGVFVKLENIVAGDFPELGLDYEEEEEEETEI